MRLLFAVQIEASRNPQKTIVGWLQHRLPQMQAAIWKLQVAPFRQSPSAAWLLCAFHRCFPLLLPLASTRTHLSGTFVTQLILYRAPTPSPEHQLSNYSAIQEINYPLQPDTKLVNFGKTCAFIQFDSPSTQTSFRSLGVLLTYWKASINNNDGGMDRW